jgi:IclR family pca regulon transcriptional regulator
MPIEPTPSANGAADASATDATIAQQIDALADPSFMTSLARGLAVLQAFAGVRGSVTVAQISQKTGIPRAAVARCLYTLKQLGFADADGNNYSLRPKVLSLGHSYLSSAPLSVSAQPYLDQISRQLNESSSLAVLDDREVLYIARSSTARVMSVALNAGSRLPAYCTSLGRVMLAHLPQAELQAYFEQVRMSARTEHTVTDEQQLRALLAGVREQGYALNNEELELGLRSIAVPVRGASGVVHAALNVGAQAARVSAARMVEEFLPVLQQGARELAVLLP